MMEAEGSQSAIAGQGEMSIPSTSEHGTGADMQSSVLRPARPVFMPETFTGVGREWSDWSEQFELAAEVNQWEEGLKLKFMSLLLAGRARDMYSGLPVEAKSNYALLKSALTRCFEPSDSDDWSRASFTSRRRQPNESAREFGNSLRRLVARAYPTADERTRDMLARDQFILHFATGDFRVNLRAAKPKTLEEAINLSSEMELLRSLEKTYLAPESRVMGVSVTKSSSEVQMEMVLGMMEELRQEVRCLQSTVKSLQLTPAPIVPPKLENPRNNQGGQSRGLNRNRLQDAAGGCWECGCTRHQKRDLPLCTGKLEGAGIAGQLPASTHAITSVASAGRLGGVGYIKGKVGGVETLLLVDSGATLSIIPKSLWLDMTKGGSELMGYSGDVAAANGGGMVILGKWQTVCQLDSLALVAEFLVADVPAQEILLGFDFLTKYGALLDFGKKECRVMGKLLPLLVPADMDTPKTVIVSTNTVIPPRSETIIMGKMESVCAPGRVGMLEPSDSVANHCNVMVARVVCTIDQDSVPVRVINVTNEALTLKGGMKLGMLHTDIEVANRAEHLGGTDNSGAPSGSWSVDSLLSHLGLHQKGFEVQELAAVRDLLRRNLSVFSTGDHDLGRTHLTLHQIDTGNAKPVKLPPRRIPLHLQQEVAEHLKEMLDHDIVQPSHSPWAAPVVLVRKRDGGLRFCIDYRKLNEVTQKDAYPLPRIDDALDCLSKACWFSTLDLASGYWQVEVDPKDKQKTAFITRQGLFEFNVLSFGLCNSPGTFQRLMDLVLADLQWTTCLVYLDDIIVFGRTFHEHLSRLDEVLNKLQQANLKVKPVKCNLFSPQVQYLGHIISAQGVEADPAKVEAVRQWPVPKNQTEVKSFVGLASYYRRFVKGFAEIARPLHQLTEKGRRFKWTDECQAAFEKLKASLMSAPILAYPDPHKTFILDTDASDAGIGAVLSQEEAGYERVIAYASRALTKQERKYATTKKELLSMVTFTKHFKHYLLGKEFVLRTDHGSLRWLHNFQELEGQLARWLEQLANFQYKIVHRPGRVHSNADALSRLPAFLSDELVPSEQVEVASSPVAHPICAVLPRESQNRCGLEELDELRDAQKEDGEITKIISLRGEKTQVQHRELPNELKKFAPVWSQLQMQEGRLVRIPPANSDAAKQVQVVLPSSLVPKVLEQLHNSVTAGHLGIQKMQAKVKDRFYWPGWFDDVRRWCRECKDCGSRKLIGPLPCAPLQLTTVSRPFERVAVDILGPLPETASRNKYILVIGDYFSKWTEAFAIPNQEAQTVAKVLVEGWVCRLGAPRTVHTDQGRNFESILFKEMCQLLNIQKTRTSPYHPQSDGMVERFNRTLLSMLSLFVEENQMNWDALLPYVMLAYRSSVHSSTGFTPFKVVFGQEMVLPLDIMLAVGERGSAVNATDYVSRLRDTLSTVFGAVRKHQTKASGRQKEVFDVRAQCQYYAEGELVWVRSNARRKGICPKLQRRFKGPYRVVERLTDVLYLLKLVDGGAEMTVHFNRLKPCLSPVPEMARPVGQAAPRGKRPTCQPEASSHSSWVPWRVPEPMATLGQERDPSGRTSPPRMPANDPEEGGQAAAEEGVSSGHQPPEPASAEGPLPNQEEVQSGSLEQRSQDPRPQRKRRPPVWARDYEIS